MGPFGQLWCCAPSPDDRLLAVASVDKCVLVLDALKNYIILRDLGGFVSAVRHRMPRCGTCLLSARALLRHQVTSVAWSADGRFLAAGEWFTGILTVFTLKRDGDGELTDVTRIKVDFHKNCVCTLPLSFAAAL